jgi:hypothetical protein
MWVSVICSCADGHAMKFNILYYTACRRHQHQQQEEWQQELFMRKEYLNYNLFCA